MPSRRKPKPSVKAKERAEPHLGGRKRDAPRKPRKREALKTPDRPSRRTASEFLAKMERQPKHRDRRAVLPPDCQRAAAPGHVDGVRAPERLSWRLRGEEVRHHGRFLQVQQRVD